MRDMNQKQIGERLGRFVPSLLKRFVRGREGSAAIEFGFVALPFLGLIFAIIETALVFLASQTLEAAVANSARLIMTGQAQTAGYTQANFKTAVCAQLTTMFDCSNGISVNVKTYTNFASVDNTLPVTNGALDTSKFVYQPGTAGDIVVVQLYYQWPVYVSLMSDNLSTLSGGKRLLIATAAFRNEPYLSN